MKYRAGLAGGERAARKHDVFLARPRPWRNQAWETDHSRTCCAGHPRRSDECTPNVRLMCVSRTRGQHGYVHRIPMAESFSIRSGVNVAALDL
ncbi:hypothetical protein BM536_037000 [Streptomyces phaeoluteigriseus]|uniref:Uncharacterized protein n=1 Tax=Streptomyces phaeoluteigriseus TaxID=114686 RepID=A0A1V6MHZ6_9ACTN|nr:hypothetical protein BM536_037000 [Streptomyces phaeoluteigriseus]